MSSVPAIAEPSAMLTAGSIEGASPRKLMQELMRELQDDEGEAARRLAGPDDAVCTYQLDSCTGGPDPDCATPYF